MRKHVEKLIRFGILLLFISCGSLPSESLKTFMDSSKKEGMLVGTISLENRRTISPDFVFRIKKKVLPSILTVKIHDSLKALGDYQYNYGGIVIDKAKGDFVEDEKWVYLFNIVRPAGKYDFYQLSLLLNTGYMKSTHDLPMEIPLEIEEGKIKYIGEIKLNVKKGEIKVLNNID
ncbi:hypothetical protein KHA90_23325 [Flavobacterium psychroterrae]|uniref:Lipoprotein n=1 Tax=Flavobacterium psychroterrae TaxID=2133767 RepID=A0ABS5PJ03_9FLAO|nr:hypothetical protein [Flavobacterium psychroterrae]MBS7233945.1 hypothetical protein [Flavobacterium psychroterrae]